MIATAIASALACGIEDLQVSLGQVDFFRGFLAEFDIGGEEAEMLPRLIDGKEMVALEELAERLQLPERGREVLLKMASSYGTFDRSFLPGFMDMSFRASVSACPGVASLERIDPLLFILPDMQNRRAFR